MGEKTYTAKAKPVLFFARYEASVSGNDQVEPEHVLLGLARADAELLRKLCRTSEEPADYVRAALQTATVVKPTSNTFGEPPPLSAAAKTIFDLAVVQSDRLNHDYIGTEHILLSLLEQSSTGSQILHELGLTCEDVMRRIANGSITDQNEQISDGPVLGGRIARSD